MKKKNVVLFSVLLAMIFPAMISAQDSNRWEIRQGEKLKFKVAFSSGLTGDVKGGEATMTMQSKTVKVGSRDAYHATLTGGTAGVIEWFYQVENKYESYIDVKTKAPLVYIQSTHENKYQSRDTVRFDQHNNIATYRGKKIEMPDNTQDFLSVFYYVRMLDISNLKKGDTFSVPFFSSNKVTTFKIVYNGIETLKTKKLGKISCYSFKPQLPSNKVFKDQYPATMWISADNKRLPVLVDAKLKVGRMKMELLEYQ